MTGAGKGRVPTSAVRDHVALLRSQGARLVDVQRAAGVSRGWLAKACGPRPPETVDAAIAEKVLSLGAEDLGAGARAPVGELLAQLERLKGLGWTASSAAEAVGASPDTLHAITREGTEYRTVPASLLSALAALGEPPLEAQGAPMSPEASAERLRQLRASGWEWSAMARETGLSVECLRRLAGPRPPAFVRASTEARLLALPDEPPEAPPRGACAAAASAAVALALERGWAIAQVAGASGLNYATVARLAERPRACLPAVADAVTGARLSCRPPAPVTKVGSGASFRALQGLLASGWAMGDVARESGLSLSCLDRLLAKGEGGRVSARTERAIVALEGCEPERGIAKMPSGPVLQRLDDLLEGGQRASDVAERAGVPKKWVWSVGRARPATVSREHGERLLTLAPAPPFDLAPDDPGTWEQWSLEEMRDLSRLVSGAEELGSPDRVLVRAVCQSCHKGASEAWRAVRSVRRGRAHASRVGFKTHLKDS